jgi:CDP-diacylglycerol--glycerol-3-phosphate 3-phosphatidyltransferase
MLMLTSITAVQRFIKVWKQAAVAPATEVKIEERLARRESKHAVRQERRHSNRRPSSR